MLHNFLRKLRHCEIMHMSNRALEALSQQMRLKDMHRRCREVLLLRVRYAELAVDQTFLKLPSRFDQACWKWRTPFLTRCMTPSCCNRLETRCFGHLSRGGAGGAIRKHPGRQRDIVVSVVFWPVFGGFRGAAARRSPAAAPRRALPGPVPAPQRGPAAPDAAAAPPGVTSCFLPFFNASFLRDLSCGSRGTRTTGPCALRACFPKRQGPGSLPSLADSRHRHRL